MKPRYTYIENVISNLKCSFSIPVDIEKICSDLGFHYIEDELDGISGAAIVDGTKKMIFVNSTENEPRKRFTGAHEVAHLLLHGNETLNFSSSPQVMFRDSSSAKALDWKEREANYFAATLIMPKEELLSRLDSYEDDDVISEDEISEIAKDFGVSIQAMCIRLSQLGFMSY